MNLTAVEKILMNHSVHPVAEVSPGDILTCRIDYAGMHEGWDARKYLQFTELGEMTGVFDPEKLGMFLGHHFCTGHSDELAEDQKKTRDWAEKLGIREGDWVYIETKMGRIKQKARLTSAIDPGVVVADYGWWFPERGVDDIYGWSESNVNLLTDNKPPYNREIGSPTLRGILCKVYRA
jgi:homoaconitase/3-isopropylmalate dehydratase large subunit